MKYLPYQPFINENYPSTNVVPENMFRAQQIGFKKLKEYIGENNNNVHWLLKKINLDSEKVLNSILTPEQMDSVCLAIYNIEHNREFIIGDDTGIGKGRILASIARYALTQNNMKVIFFTEGSHLFSDFYRDLKNTETEQYVKPFILHGKASIYDPEGNLIAKNYSKPIMQQMINDGVMSYFDKKYNATIEINPNFIFTTYSQFNSLLTAKEKIKLIKSYCESADKVLVIFDEFHNSTGESNTKDMKNAILNIHHNIVSVYSSATFLDDYKQILSFKNLLGLDEKDIKLRHALLKTQSNEFKNQLAFNMVANLSLLRREHEEMQKINYVEIDQNSKQKFEKNVNQYTDIMFQFFNCYSIAEKISKEKSNSEYFELQNKWLTLGSKINRINKILLLLGKKDYLIQSIKETIAEDKKAVVILDSTFESIIKSAMNYENLIINKSEVKSYYSHLDFKTVILEMIYTVFTGKEIDESKQNKKKKKPAINYLELNHNELNNEYQKLLKLIDDLPVLDLNFIDSIKSEFPNALEISGRSIQVEKNEDGYVVKPLTLPHKTIAINQFNNSTEHNLIIITRSGSTGTSLHASQDFKDQRIRKMFEPEITPRVKVRKQFFGRVNRRGQFNKPEFISIVSGLPFEQRIVALEEQKNKNMRAFIGSDYEVESLEYDYYNDHINSAIQLYLGFNFNICKKLGIDINCQDDNYFIDSVLKRSLFLSSEEQKNIFDFLSSAHQYYCEYMDSLHNNMKQNTILFKSILPLWAKNKNDLELFKKLDRKEKVVTNLPVIFTSEIITEYENNNITENHLKANIDFNKEKFNKSLYNQSIKAIAPTLSFIYFKDELDNIISNFKIMEKLDIGEQIQFDYKGDLYYGYIENIEFKPEFKKFSTHYLYSIRLINPIYLKEHKRHEYALLKITGDLLIENKVGCLKTFGKNINIQKYIRNNEIFKRTSKYLMGDLFYLNYFNIVHKLGNIIGFDKEINGIKQQFFGIQLNDNVNNEQVQVKFQGIPLVSYDLFKNKAINSGVTSMNSFIQINKIKKDNKDLWVLKIQDRIYDNENYFPFIVKKTIDDAIYTNKAKKHINQEKKLIEITINNAYVLHKILPHLFNNTDLFFI